MIQLTCAGALARRALLCGGLAAACATGPWGVAAQAGQCRRLGADPPASQAITINAVPLTSFRAARPDARRFGGLEFRGGLVLSSASGTFGGWSGLVMAADGRSLVAVSDRGFWLRANVGYEGNRPVALADARFGHLRARSGCLLDSKRERDAEAIALLGGSLEHGTLLVGFERLHRIGRFQIRDGEIRPPSEYLRLPALARRMATNQGIEAVAVVRAGPLRGSLVAFAERFTRGSGYHTGWLWTEGRPHRLQLRDLDGFDITDAAGLPDGGLLVLERYFSWSEGVHMRIRRILPGEIRPGARLSGRIVFQGDSRHEIDNMEGLAVHRGARGETVVSLISDDNYNRLLQRTVFLQFTLLE